jgi:hypothetical protein
MTSTHRRRRMVRSPKADEPIRAELSARFRRKELWSYCYENGVWSTWATRHDYAATQRNGRYRCECAPDCGYGPTDWDRAELLAWLGLEDRPARRARKPRQPKVPAEHEGGSEIVRALEAAYGKVRKLLLDLPAVVIITGSGQDSHGVRWGHFARDRWIDALNNGRRPELFVGGERLACGAELTLQTLLHECVHALACVRGVQDTSRQGRYHNGQFRTLAQEVGLTYPHASPDAALGYSAVELTDDARKRYGAALDDLERAVRLHLDNPLAGTATTGGRGGHGARGGSAPRGTGGASLMRAVCACEPPRIIRVSRTVLDGAAICCEACTKAFAA